MLAVEKALEAVKQLGYSITVWMDSQLVIGYLCLWRAGEGQPLAPNQGPHLWPHQPHEPRRKAKFLKVKAHNGDEVKNERVDRFAKAAVPQ